MSDTTASTFSNCHSATLTCPPKVAKEKPAATVEPLVVGAKDLARILGISVATLFRWDSSGLLGPGGHKIGGRRLWSVAEARAWVAAGMPERVIWLAITRANGQG
jgi:hypothetical protein